MPCPPRTVVQHIVVFGIQVGVFTQIREGVMKTRGHEIPPLTIAALIADLRPRLGLLRAASESLWCAPRAGVEEVACANTFADVTLPSRRC